MCAEQPPSRYSREQLSGINSSVTRQNMLEERPRSGSRKVGTWRVPEYVLKANATRATGDYKQLQQTQAAAQSAADLDKAQRFRQKQKLVHDIREQQLQEQQQQRQARARHKADDHAKSVQLTHSIAQQEAAEAQQRQAAMLQQRMSFSKQVRELHEHQRQEQLAEQEHNAAMRKQLEEARRQDQSDKAQKAKENRDLLAVMARDNQLRMEARANHLRQQKEEDTRYVEKYQEMLDGWERKRVAEQEAFRAKVDVAYKVAGGRDMERRLAEKAHLEELKFIQAVMEHDAALEKDEAARKQAILQKERDALRILDQQVAERETKSKAERQDWLSHAEAVKQNMQSEDAASKLLRAIERRQKQQVLEEQVEAMKVQVSKRWDEYNEVMTEREKKVHQSVLEGRSKGFAWL